MRRSPLAAVASFFALSFVSGTHLAHAEIPLPRGAIAGCPFIHEDSYDLNPLIETLKGQIQTKLQGKSQCLQTVQNIHTRVSALQDFYRSIDPAARERIAKSVYANTLSALESRRLQLEAAGKSESMEYSSLFSQIQMIQSSDMENEISLQALDLRNPQEAEAAYRAQLLSHVSGLLNSYTTTLRENPQCVDSIGGWNQVLASVMGGVSLATGLGTNPAGTLIGAAASVGVQFVTLLQDARVRSAYNDLIRIQNHKTLACTYYAVKRTACEYRRAYGIAQDVDKLRQFARNRFDQTLAGEYERFFVNVGRVNAIGQIFQVIAQMGSPLTIDLSLLASYLEAKAVDFTRLGTPPDMDSPEEVIRSWLIRAQTLGVRFGTYDNQTGGGTLPIKDQLRSALNDINVKKSTIAAAEAMIRQNQSFLDLRRRISSEFPNMQRNVREMIAYLDRVENSALVPAQDRPTLSAARDLLQKLDGFLSVAARVSTSSDEAVEDEVVSKGSAVFEALAHGSVAQLTKQSVVALSSRGVDRLNWALGTIRNAYLNRDIDQNLEPNQTFGRYRRDRDSLAQVIADYRAFSGSGTTFRNEEATQAIRSFEKSFRREMIGSLETAMRERSAIPELQGETAAHLCALYATSLREMNGRPSRLLEACRAKYGKLQMNRLVSKNEFAIDYEDDCSYFTYIRELEVQNLLAQLIKP